MKKNVFFCAALLFLTASAMLSAQTLKAGAKITVSPPALQNGGNDDAWIPLFIQSQLSTDLQNYSGLTVLDRLATEQLAGEQLTMETAAAANNDSVTIRYAETVAADYIVSVSVLKTGASYALDYKVLDVALSTPVGRAYSNANVSEATLKDGSVIHEACYTLLTGLGVAPEKLAGLKQQSKEQDAEVAANFNVAKGIATERSGGNIVEAMAYYQKAVGSSAAITEGAARLNNLTATLSGVNIGAAAKNDIAARKEWIKVWDDLREYISNNWAYIAYCPALIKMGQIDYQRETVNVSMPVAWRTDPVCMDLYYRILGAYRAQKKEGNWNLSTSTGNNYGSFTVKLYNESGKEISSVGVNGISIWNSSFSMRWIEFRGVNPDDISDSLQVKVIPDCKGGKAFPLPVVR